MSRENGKADILDILERCAFSGGVSLAADFSSGSSLSRRFAF